MEKQTSTIRVLFLIFIMLTLIGSFVFYGLGSFEKDAKEYSSDICDIRCEFMNEYLYHVEKRISRCVYSFWRSLIDNIGEYKNESSESSIINYIYDICERYSKVDPELIQSIVYYESRFNPNAVSKDGFYVGLMQLSKKWHQERAERLTGSINLFDPYTNLATGIDLINDLIEEYGEDNLDLVLMLYNGSGGSAFKRHASGNPTNYATKVLSMREELLHGNK